MFPIEAYVNDYIAAISNDMRQSRRNPEIVRTRSSALDRLYKTVAGMLKKGAAGATHPTNPLPSS